MDDMFRILNETLFAFDPSGGGIVWNIAFEPLPSAILSHAGARGGNALGLGPEDGDSFGESPSLSLCLHPPAKHTLPPSLFPNPYQLILRQWSSSPPSGPTPPPTTPWTESPGQPSRRCGRTPRQRACCGRSSTSTTRGRTRRRWLRTARRASASWRASAGSTTRRGSSSARCRGGSSYGDVHGSRHVVGDRKSVLSTPWGEGYRRVTTGLESTSWF